MFAALGSSLEQLDRLRARESGGGRMLTSSSAAATDLLPLDTQSAEPPFWQSPRKCFLSGSANVNLLPGIAALHTVWLRQHNRIADRLKVKYM